MNLKINKVSNGYLIEYIDSSYAEPKTIQVVYQLPDGDDERKDECEKYREMLYDLLEILDFHYNKHEKYNLSIDVESDEEMDG